MCVPVRRVQTWFRGWGERFRSGSRVRVIHVYTSKSSHRDRRTITCACACVCEREGEHDVGDDMSGSMAWMDEKVAIATLLFFFFKSRLK